MLHSLHAVSHRTVLLLEDEPIIRGATAEALADAGMRVIEAGDAAAALAWLHDDPTIDVMVADIHLAGSISGRQAGEQARMIRPDLRIVFTSGAEPRSLPPHSVFLPKPYRLKQLLDAAAGFSLVDDER